MPTLSGLRRRGYTPEAIRALRRRDRRRQARERRRRRPARVLRARGPEQARAARDGRAAPAQGRHRELSRRPGRGRWTSSTTRRIRRPARARCRSRGALYIEQDDFREDPPKKFFRLAPGREVRLRNAYFVTCQRRRQGRRGRDRRAALHLRPGDARRRRARRPQGEGDAPLGVGGARRRRRGAALRSAVQRRESRRRRRGLPDAAESRVARSRCSECKVEPSLARAPRRARASSSSASATSPSIPTPGPARPSSTAR